MIIMIITLSPDDRFYLHPVSRTKVSSYQGQHDTAQPILLFSAADCDMSATGLLMCLEGFLARDDDFHSEFISETVVVQLRNGQAFDENELLKSLNASRSNVKPSWSVRRIVTTNSSADESPLPSGPYFLLNGYVHEAYTLFEDHLQAFHTTVVPDSLSPERYSILDATSKDGLSKVIAVPSRMYSKPTNEKPLSGMRVAIKDNYALAGIKTSLQCLSFQETYGPEADTAAYIKKLIDLGAVIVGKTKMTAFASGEKPCDWVEFQCPFNPRGDGYLSAGGSTTGGAAAIAGYKWLDYSIGSDTFGSVRQPAALTGVFGIRCSTDIAASSKGLYPSCPYFDTIGYLGRDIKAFRMLTTNSLSSTLKNTSKYPKRILYPVDYLPYKDIDQQAIAEEFIVMLEKFLGVQRIEISLANLWDKHPPPEANKKPLAEFIHTSGYNPFYYDGYHEFDNFRDEHKRQFNKRVYVSPRMQHIWNLGAVLSSEARNKSFGELEIFQSWFKQHVLAVDEHTCSTAIMILPVGAGQPIYRDIVVPYVERYGLDPLNLGAFLRIPQVVVPIGQKPYDSRITGRIEQLPVACSIAGAAGSDLMLVNLINDTLISQGWPTEVKTGSASFSSDRGIGTAADLNTPTTSSFVSFNEVGA